MKPGTQATPEDKLYRRLKKTGQLCPAWKDFQVFYQDVGDIPDRHRLSRLNNKQKYGPGNVRWVKKRPSTP